MMDALNPNDKRIKHETLRDMKIFLIELLTNKESSNQIFSSLSDEEISDRLSQALGMGVLPENERLNRMKKIENHLIAIQHYQPTPYDGKVLFFEMQKQIIQNKNSFQFYESWTNLVPGRLQIAELEGTHSTMLDPPYCNPLIHTLAARLNNAWRNNDYT